MKKNITYIYSLLALVFILFVDTQAEGRIIKAEDVITWGAPGSVWGYSGSLWQNGRGEVNEYLKDTTIQGQVVKKIRIKKTSIYYPTQKSFQVNRVYDLYFKYQNDSIWMWEEVDQAFVFFLAFNLKVGDSIPYVVPKKICNCTGGQQWSKVVEVRKVHLTSFRKKPSCPDDTLEVTELVMQEDTNAPLVRSDELIIGKSTEDVDLRRARYSIYKNIGFRDGLLPKHSSTGSPPGSIGVDMFDRYCKQGVDSAKFRVIDSFIPAVLGSYYSDNHYCVLGDSNYIKRVLSTPSIAQGSSTLFERGIKVYPNPAETQLHYVLPFEGAYRLVVYSIIGREVLNKQIRKSDNKKETVQTIDISRFPAGIYTLKLVSSVGIFTTKFIKL